MNIVYAVLYIDLPAALLLELVESLDFDGEARGVAILHTCTIAW